METERKKRMEGREGRREGGEEGWRGGMKAPPLKGIWKALRWSLGLGVRTAMLDGYD